MNTEKGSAYHILAFCFDKQSTAKRVDQELKNQQWTQNYVVLAHAVVEVDDKGKTHVHQPGHGGVGATLGALGGGLLALIGGPAGLLAWVVAGGVVGGVAGHYFGRVIPMEDLNKLGEQMEPDTSAIVALVEDLNSEGVIDSMAGYNANVVTLTVGDELSGEIATTVSADIQGDSDTGKGEVQETA